LKLGVSQITQASDTELKFIQTALLDSMAPITTTGTKGETITHKEAIYAAMAAIALVGNANAKISHLRSTKIITQMNKVLLPLTDDNDNLV